MMNVDKAGRSFLKNNIPVMIIAVLFGVMAESHWLLFSGDSVSFGGRLLNGIAYGLLFYLAAVFLGRFIPLSSRRFKGPVWELVEADRSFFIGLLVFLPVVVFNLFHVFGPLYLLADDPSGYHTGIKEMARTWLWQNRFVLNAFTETFSWHLMAHYSPFVVRLLYLVFYLSGISLSLYWIIRKIFRLRPGEAFLAAVLPAILPLQFQIIAGVNMSYTLLGQLLVLLSLIFGFNFLRRKEFSWLLLLLSALLFTAATRQMEQSVFVAGAVCFVYLLVVGSPVRKAALILPVVLASAAVLHRMIFAPRRAAEIQEIPLSEIVHRGKTFLLYLSPYLSPVHRELAIPIVAVLLLVGAGVLLFRNAGKGGDGEQDHFAWIPAPLRGLTVPGFALLWTVPSILPFIALNRHMDARTMHLSGYGPWLMIAPGLVFLLGRIFRSAGEEAARRAGVSVILLLVLVSGIQHTRYAAGIYREPNLHWRAISKSITHYGFPEGSQIAIVDANTGTHNSYPPCTGYLARMLGNRTDIGGIVGPECFFYDPFTVKDLWRNPMTGLKGMDNLHLFKLEMPDKSKDEIPGPSLRKMQYFLRVFSGEASDGRGRNTGEWGIYQWEEQGGFSMIHEGRGLDEYLETLEVLEAGGLSRKEICWGDPGDPPGVNSPLR